MSTRASRSRVAASPARAAAESRSTRRSPAGRAAAAEEAAQAAAAQTTTTTTPNKKRTAKRAASPAARRTASKSPAKKRATRRATSVTGEVSAEGVGSGKKKRSTKKASTKSPAKRTKSPAKRARSPAGAAEVSPAKKSRTRKSTSRARVSTPSPSRSASPAAKPRAKRASRQSVAGGAAANRRRATVAAAPLPPAEEVDEEMLTGSETEREEDATLLSPPARTPTRATRFSAAPQEGGLGFMPRQASYPVTPKAVGVSSLLTALADVPVPTAVFVSPFPADRHQTDRRSFGGSRPNEQTPHRSARQVLTYDDAEEQAGDDDEEEEEDDFDDEGDDEVADEVISFKNPSVVTPAPRRTKTLRPTATQEAAERARVPQPRARQQDTPTPLSRARSRLSSTTTTSHSTTTSTRHTAIDEHRAPVTEAPRSTADVKVVQQASSQSVSKRFFAVAPFVLVGLVILAVAHFLALQASAPQNDVLGLTAAVAQVQAAINDAVNTYVRPHLDATYAAAIPAIDLARLTAPLDAVFLIVPVLYLLAGYIVKRGFELSIDEAALLPPTAVEASARAQVCRAHRAFVLIHALVAAASAFVFYTAAQTYPPVTLRPDQVQPPVFAPEWAHLFVVLTTFSWSLVEVIQFAGDLSETHLALWVPLLVASELAFWRAFPTTLLAFAPPGFAKVFNVVVAHLPDAIGTVALTMPLVIAQAAESIKAAVSILPCSRFLLVLVVPGVYLAGASHVFAELGEVVGAAWLESLMLVVGVGAISVWEVSRQKYF